MSSNRLKGPDLSQRPLLIGQAPGPNTDPNLPLFPMPLRSAGGRLQTIMGIDRPTYLEAFERVNLLPYFPGTQKREDCFPMTAAKLAVKVTAPFLAGRTVVMVGRKVADAFELDQGWHEWKLIRMRRYMPFDSNNGRAHVAVVPHPSGRNPWYAEEGNRERARAFWDALLNNLRKVLPSVTVEFKNTLVLTKGADYDQAFPPKSFADPDLRRCASPRQDGYEPSS